MAANILPSGYCSQARGSALPLHDLLVTPTCKVVLMLFPFHSSGGKEAAYLRSPG